MEKAKQLSALSHRRRLAALVVLKERAEPLEPEALATAVAARELGVPRDDLTDREAEKVHLSFYHVHLPKLLDVGVVERTAENRVRLADDAEDVHRIADAVFDD